MSTGAVLAGVFVAVSQLRSLARTRQFELVVKLYGTFGEAAFQNHYQRVLHWSYASYAEFAEKATAEERTSLFVVGIFFENMGLLFKRKLAPLDLLDDLLSGPVCMTWEKLQPILLGLRAGANWPQAAEWFEMLYVAMKQRLTSLSGESMRPS